MVVGILGQCLRLGIPSDAGGSIASHWTSGCVCHGHLHDIKQILSPQTLVERDPNTDAC